MSLGARANNDRSDARDGPASGGAPRGRARSAVIDQLLSRHPFGIEALEERLVPAIFTVTNNLDAGAGSLRQAILDANAAGGMDTVDFDAALDGQTITLTGGEIAIGDDLLIDGLGADRLAISGNSASRVFTADDGAGGYAAITLRDLTITGGLAGAGNGGAIRSVEDLTIENSIVSNSAANSGGGVYSRNGTLVIRSSTITGNTSTRTSADRGGGGVFNVNGALRIHDSALHGNSANAYGGAIYSRGATSVVQIDNSTISGNTADADLSGQGYGGGIGLGGSAVATVRNSTIASNTARSGGGIDIDQSTLTLESVIVGDNSATGGNADISRNLGTLNASNSLLESDFGLVNGVDSANVTGMDPNLAPLADNAGVTKTQALLTASPALNAGSNPGALVTDQRGAGFPRVIGAQADIGAYEFDSNAPTVTLDAAPDVNVLSSTTTYDVTVTYTATTLMDAGSIDAGDLSINGPGGMLAAAMVVSITPDMDNQTLQVVYRFTPPGGAWDSTDDGTYTITVEANEVTNTDGTAVATQAVGTFDVDVTLPTATVTSAPNVGATSDPSRYDFVVRFDDAVAIDVSSIATNNFTINGPGGMLTSAAVVSILPATDSTTNTVTYRFTPPGGAWDSADNGAYAISLGAVPVTDISGNAVATLSGPTMFAVNVTAPTATVTMAPDVTDAGMTTYDVVVRYASSGAIDVASIGANNLRIDGPAGALGFDRIVSITPGAGAMINTVTYRFTLPGGEWDFSDNGAYSVSLGPNPVADSLGIPVEVLGGTTSFAVDLFSGAAVQVGGTLTLKLTDRDDTVVFHQGSVHVTVNGQPYGPFDDLEQIIVDTLDGDDVIRILDPIRIPFVIDGGPGTDELDLSAIAGEITTEVGGREQSTSIFEGIEIVDTGPVVFLDGAELNGRIDANGAVLDFSRLTIPIDALLFDGAGLVNGLLFVENVGRIVAPLLQPNSILFAPAAAPNNASTSIGATTPGLSSIGGRGVATNANKDGLPASNVQTSTVGADAKATSVRAERRFLGNGEPPVDSKAGNDGADEALTDRFEQLRTELEEIDALLDEGPIGKEDREGDAA